MSLHLSTISAARACRSVRSLKLLTVILQHQAGATHGGMSLVLHVVAMPTAALDLLAAAASKTAAAIASCWNPCGYCGDLLRGGGRG
jgi:hypothetical protein